DLLLGGRYSRVEIENRPSPAEDFEEFTPQLGLTVEITEGVAAFAGYSEGFRAPTFAPLAGTVEPERSQHREVGVKFGGRGGVSGTLAAYELTRTNVPTPDPLNPFVQIQTGEQRARGLEADVVWEPLSRLSILFAYAYAETEVTADNSIPLGDRLIRVPDHSGRIAVRYRPRSLPRLGVGLGATAFSSREITLPNLDEADGGVLTDFQASYRLGPMQIGLSVVNLLDEFLFEPYQYLSQSVVVPTQPRSVFASVRLGF
ncbi:MAG: TonB-dependent receptor, partial [Acidobacteriota bacterium]